MPGIRPFCALLPTPQKETKLVCNSLVNYLSKGQGELAENLDYLLASQVLEFDTSPCLYVYRVLHHGMSQVGLWTLTNISDYNSGKIKKHELTILSRENMVVDYLTKTRLDFNPVLLTYTPTRVVDAIIAKYVLTMPVMDLLFNDASRHSIWRISNAEDLTILSDTFNNIQSVYIADGHHRLASMAKSSIENRHQNSLNHTGEEAYNYFSSI
jgi:uncharacterized protein (DUF1015 family)